MKKNKESKRSAKRDLVKCFYDDAILPAGDVQGNDLSERAKGPVGSCITCGWEKRMLPNGGLCASLLQVFALKVCCAWSGWHRLMHEARHVSWP